MTTNKRISDLETAVNPRSVKYAVVWGDDRGVSYDGVTFTAAEWETMRAQLAADQTIDVTEIVINYQSGAVSAETGEDQADSV